MSVDRLRDYTNEKHGDAIPLEYRDGAFPQEKSPVAAAQKLIEAAVRKQPAACLAGGLVLGVILGCIVKRQ